MRTVPTVCRSPVPGGVMVAEPVPVLGAPGRAVPQEGLDGAMLGQLGQVALRRRPADPQRPGDLAGGDVGRGRAYGVADEPHRRRGETLTAFRSGAQQAV